MERCLLKPSACDGASARAARRRGQHGLEGEGAAVPGTRLPGERVGKLRPCVGRGGERGKTKIWEACAHEDSPALVMVAVDDGVEALIGEREGAEVFGGVQMSKDEEEDVVGEREHVGRREHARSWRLGEGRWCYDCEGTCKHTP